MKVNYLARKLSLIILAVLPLYYFRFSILGVPTNVIELLVALLFVLTLLEFRKFRLPNIWPIGLIVIGLLLSVTVALDRTSALGIFKGWFVVPIIYYGCISTLFKSEERKLFVYPAIFGLVFVSAYAILQRFGVIGLLEYQLPDAKQYIIEGRAVGFFESPNFLAMYLVPLTLLVGGYLALTKSFRACWWLVLPLAATFLSQSRAGILALAAGVVWLIFLSKGTETGKTRSAWLLTALVGLVAILLVSYRGADDQQRLYIWQQACLMIKAHPLFGIGPGQFQANFSLLGDQSGQFTAALPYALHPHNVFLNFYLSAGLLGLIGFVWLLVGMGLNTLRNTLRSPLVLAASAALIAILVHGLFDSTYFKNDLAIIFWVLVFLIGNGYKEVNENRT